MDPLATSRPSTAPPGGRAPKAAKPKEESKKDKIIRENTERISGAAVDQLAERWAALREQLDMDKELTQRSIGELLAVHVARHALFVGGITCGGFPC